MNEELLGLDLVRSVPSVDVPVFFFLGRHDRHVEATVAANYFGALRAPVKQLLWFENSAHNIPFEEPDLFNANVVSTLQSLAFELRTTYPLLPGLAKGNILNFHFFLGRPRGLRLVLKPSWH
jgi:hypothetical protein